MNAQYSPPINPLLEPVLLSEGILCRNRIALAAMTHYSAPEDGSVAEPELAYIRRRSAGPGIVFTACVAVSPCGKAYDGEPAAHDDRFLPGLSVWAKVIKDQGARAILQLHHGGGVCPPRLVPYGDVVSPSGIATPDRSPVTPRALSDTEIEVIIEAFGSATTRAVKAGFDGVEIHGGYGYLPQQFLSPYTNRRQDRWGGTREKRHAFPLALLVAARNAAKESADRPFSVGYRFTPEEALDPGLTMDDALAFVDALVDQGSDYIDVLVNDFRSPPRRGSMQKDRSRLCHIAQTVAKRVPVLAGGAIYTEADAHEALAMGVDFVTMARALIIDPEWVQKVATGQSGSIRSLLAPDEREALTMPAPFWNVIWKAPGWFPGV
ncbi:NADH-dependent flavin oxidoreductase [Sphingomonas sp. PP-CC-3G-468]|uniref:NADH-dependent flavin oxidoreductase n=1 Tax=Sphingomonas sp. PP-CC-3G-468 TaxID=2135656 RepID=UPI0010460044|nr:NADH-dependent flavin oxidoreductase [Sphingomonas sp. PP-CC-3G-468]TCM07417.1 2,4-dienoyl-CoA reductase-like NADH-dependent reductase (Old Yellow Enzyme family) [Sphingomonas sp. PP-CC-3G-468]